VLLLAFRFSLRVIALEIQLVQVLIPFPNCLHFVEQLLPEVSRVCLDLGCLSLFLTAIVADFIGGPCLEDGVFESRTDDNFTHIQDGLPCDPQELLVILEVCRDFWPLLGDHLLHELVPSAQGQKFNWLGRMLLFLQKRLQIEDFLVLTDQLLPVALQDIRLSLHVLMHLLQQFVQDFRNG
jgi:hypothetical protein